jgi:phosphatidylglycerol:prolipoprotein diacylglycerol transferase
LGIIGGLIGGFFGLFLFHRFFIYHPSSIIHFLDIAFFGLPLGQAIGRIGNFINQEVYGLPTDLPWGIYIDNKPGRFHPLFAYEAVWMLLGFGLMLLAEKTNKLRWIKKSYTGFYLVWYGAGRFWLDFLRPSEFVWQLNFSSGITLNMAQTSSVLMVVLGWLLMIKLNPFVE